MVNTATSNAKIEIGSVETLMDLVHDCLDRNLPIVDYGVAHAGLGHASPSKRVDLVQHGSVIEHYERDLTVRAAAGTPMGQLQEALWSHRQFAPIDADNDVTLGEVINHNVYGPLRVAYGSTRDLLLGLRYIDGQARDIHVGGRTVKNVAGYDVTRFMVGNLGEYGVVYEATLRTYAIPHEVLQVEVSVSDPRSLDPILSEWMLTDASPASLALVFEPPQWTLHLAYFGTSHGCATQLSSLDQWLDQKESMSIKRSKSIHLEEHLQHSSSHRAWRRQATAMVRIIVPPAHTGAMCDQLMRWAEDRCELCIEAMPMHGCIFTGGSLDAPTAKALDSMTNQAIESVGGLRVWHERPSDNENDNEIAPFGPPQPDWPLLLRLKYAMDPDGLFNPGRFITRTKDQSQNLGATLSSNAPKP